MNHLLACTSWIGSGKPGDAFRPQLADTHALDGWQDVTGQQLPEKADLALPVYTVEAWCDDKTLANIAADPSAVILWSETLDDETGEPVESKRDELPDAKARTDLSTALKSLGYADADLTMLVKADVSRDDLATALIAVQKAATSDVGAIGLGDGAVEVKPT